MCLTLPMIQLVIYKQSDKSSSNLLHKLLFQLHLLLKMEESLSDFDEWGRGGLSDLEAVSAV